MEWKLFKADKTRKKWSIRGTLYNGIDVKIPGHRDKAIAEQMLRNIEKLNRAKANNELPPPEVLPWLDNLAEEVMDRLIKHGLVDRGRLERRLPLEAFMTDFEGHLKINVKKVDSRRPRVATGMLKRIIEGIPGTVNFTELTEEKVRKSVQEMTALTRHRTGQPLSVKSQREYLCIAKDFSEWMRKQGRASVDPLAELVLPPAKMNQVYNRRPQSYEDFGKLIAFLDSAPEQSQGRFQLSNYDRVSCPPKLVPPASINFRSGKDRQFDEEAFFG